MGIFSALPLGVHEANAHLVGWIAMHIVHYRRKVVEENIDRSFPDAPAQLRKKYVKDFYLHFCLLYTSPSPRDRQKSRMPSSA